MTKLERRKRLAKILLFTGLGAFVVQLVRAFVLNNSGVDNIWLMVALHMTFLTVGAVGWFMLLALKEYEDKQAETLESKQ